MCVKQNVNASDLRARKGDIYCGSVSEERKRRKKSVAPVHPKNTEEKTRDRQFLPWKSR